MTCEFCTTGTGEHHPDCESLICLKYHLVMQKERRKSELRNKLLRTEPEAYPQPEEDYDLSTVEIDADPHGGPHFKKENR